VAEGEEKTKQRELLQMAVKSCSEHSFSLK
jgi:hypothetical protein